MATIKEPTQYEIDPDAPRSSCKACSATIVFCTNPATGNHLPVNVATGRSHFLDCTDATRFSRHRPAAEKPLSAKPLTGYQSEMFR